MRGKDGCPTLHSNVALWLSGAKIGIKIPTGYSERAPDTYLVGNVFDFLQITRLYWITVQGRCIVARKDQRAIVSALSNGNIVVDLE